MTDVSVIIVNYNGGTVVANAVRAVMQTTDRSRCEVIVVDNCSSDGSAENLKSLYGDDLKLLMMPENKGFAAANNVGWHVAKGKYVLFLNPDTEVLGDAVGVLSKYLDENPKVGACGANLFDKQMNPQFSYWTLFPGAKMEWHALFSYFWLKRKHKGSHEHNFTGAAKKVAYIMGADLMVRRQLLEQLGGMSEDFFLFYEETELCYRISKAGYDIVSVPEAKIIHLEGSTIDKLRLRQKYMMRSRDIYLRKCCAPVERYMANCILWLSSIIRTLFFTLTGNKQKKEFWKYTLACLS